MRRLILITFFALVTLAAATPAFAASGSAFQPIVSLPSAVGNGGTPYGSLCDYLNSAFKLAIAGAVILAVLMIIVDGFKYMTSEAIGSKKDALGGIRSALLGLLLLLGSYLILYIVNPQILSLGVLSPDGVMLGGCTGNLNAGGTSNTPLMNQDSAQIANTALTPIPIDLSALSAVPSINFGTADWCYAPSGGGSACFPDQSTCNAAIGDSSQLAPAPGASCQQEGAASGPPSQAVCDASNEYQCAPGLSCTVTVGSGVCLPTR